MVKVGRGYRKEYRVKWTGYSRETWTKAVLLEDTAALDQWEAQHMVSTGGCHIPSSSEVPECLNEMKGKNICCARRHIT